jgi:hypothetical protein
MAIDRNGNRQGELTTLQAAATGAANGTALDVTNAVGAVFEVSGTYTNLTVNWEASVDGATWWGVGVGPLTTRTLATTTTATGLYLLANVAGLTHVRARITAGAATGSMTVKGARVEVLA